MLLNIIHSTEHLAQEVRTTLKSISCLTYNCMDEHHEALLDFSIKLDQLVTDFKFK